MNIYNRLSYKIKVIVNKIFQAESLTMDFDEGLINVESPRDPSHGDLSTNVAMVLSKYSEFTPRELGALIIERLCDSDLVRSAEIAGPGFINVHLHEKVWRECLRAVLHAGSRFGDSNIGNGEHINVEYVSTNPTGPLHVGHARGAVVGDVLSSLLQKAGYNVCREFYVNDAGAQIEALARSVYLRYCEALGEEIGEFPEDLYPGNYLVSLGRELAKKYSERWKGVQEEVWLPELRILAVKRMMCLIRSDLATIGVKHDIYTSERELVERGWVDKTVTKLGDKNLLYEGILEAPKGKHRDEWRSRSQILFRASEFGDDADRPLRKEDGSWTYFAADLAYHFDKYQRGSITLINVWGADHGGYIKRIQAAMSALTDGKAVVDVKICQIVKFLQDGKSAKMSKRAGAFVTLKELVDAVGCDVVRFIMLTRKNDAQLVFDFSRVTEQSQENPVFYVQYAHARCRSVLRLVQDVFEQIDIDLTTLAKSELDRLKDPSEFAVIKLLALWPRIVETAALTHEPHRIAFYLYDLASEFHSLWSKGKYEPSLRFIMENDLATTNARLAMVRGVEVVIASGLKVMGIVPVEEMR